MMKNISSHADVTGLDFQKVDVLSSVPLQGNPLAVVEKADTLSEATMAAVRQLDQSERDDVPPKAGTSRRRLSAENIYSLQRTSFCRPSCTRELSCLVIFPEFSRGERHHAGMWNRLGKDPA